VYYSDYELFVGEIMEFAKRAKDAGVDVGIHSVSEGQHNFILGAGRVPEVDETIEQMANGCSQDFGQSRGE
jgi:acetyl esterase/lipase